MHHDDSETGTDSKEPSGGPVIKENDKVDEETVKLAEELKELMLFKRDQEPLASPREIEPDTSRSGNRGDKDTRQRRLRLLGDKEFIELYLARLAKKSDEGSGKGSDDIIGSIGSLFGAIKEFFGPDKFSQQESKLNSELAMECQNDGGAIDKVADNPCLSTYSRTSWISHNNRVT
jgi:hypothetical protein